jgi:MATE family, multidrug efflux pump
MLLPAPSDLRAMVRLAAPVAAVQVGLMAMGVVDTMMVGHVSKAALAAGALGNLYFMIVAIFGNGVLMALDPIVAQAVGAEDVDGIGRAIRRAGVLALMLTLASAVTLGFAAPVLRVLGQPADVVPDAARYAWLCIPGALPYYLFIVLRQTLQAMHRVAPAVIAVLLGNLLNAALNWVFIYGHLGSPALGVAGSAISTSIGRWVMALVLVAVAWREVRPLIAARHRSAFAPRAVWRMARLGLPIGGQYLLEYGAFGCTALMMGLIGTTELAAHQIAINIASLTFMVPMGVSTATAVLVGHAIGAGDEERARRAASAGMLSGVGFMAVSAICLVAAPTLFARAYSTDLSVIALAATLIPIAGLFQVFDGIQVVATGILRGIGDTEAPMVINILGFWLVGLPASAWLAFGRQAGARGLWWGLVAGLAVVSTLLLLRVRSRMQRRMRRLVIDDVAGTGEYPVSSPPV